LMEYADDNSRMEYTTKPSPHFCPVGSFPLAIMSHARYNYACGVNVGSRTGRSVLRAKVV
jgi:hypothetical protein